MKMLTPFELLKYVAEGACSIPKGNFRRLEAQIVDVRDNDRQILVSSERKAQARTCSKTSVKATSYKNT